MGIPIEETDPIERAFPVGYDGEIVEDVFNVLRLCQEDRPQWYKATATKLKLDVKYVHLILEMAARADYLEYGCSPRGGWLTEKGEKLLRDATEWRRKKANETTADN